MTLIRKLALVLYLAPLCLNYSNAQEILTTPNIVSQTTWQGCATYLPTRIWGGYSGGPCPNVGLNGTGINYSYGEYTLSQAVVINQALANAGSNLQVNGYNYSWQVKNSNINNSQPGGYDPIATITVSLTDKNKNTIVGDVYNYGYHLPGWTTFSGTRTYDNPYALDSLGTIGLSVRSKDSGYWAGYYGPEFQNFRLSLNYSVTQPSSPPVLPTNQTNTPTLSIKTISTAIASVDPTNSPVTSVNVGGAELSTSGTISVPDGVPQTVKESVATVTKEQTDSKPGAPMSLIMSVIGKIQENDRATQRAAVQNAAQQVSLSVSKSQEQAMSVVSSLNSMSVASSQASMQSTTVTETQQSGQGLSLPSMQQTQQLSLSYSIETPILIQPQQQIFNTQNKNSQVEMPSISMNTTTSRTNTLTELMESKTPLDSLKVETQNETVNKNVQSNELAGKVDIAMMALQPRGYESYSFIMKDVTFYEPKEIYNKQTNVDNIKVLRQLSSDRLHQEMVDQQYKGK